MLTLLLGIISSVLAEVVTALNKKLQGTVLTGDGAFIVAFAIAMVGGVVKEIMTPAFEFSDLFNLSMLTSDCAQVFAVSQVYFLLVAQKLNLDVPSTPTTVTTGTAAAPASFQG